MIALSILCLIFIFACDDFKCCVVTTYSVNRMNADMDGYVNERYWVIYNKGILILSENLLLMFEISFLKSKHHKSILIVDDCLNETSDNTTDIWL